MSFNDRTDSRGTDLRTTVIVGLLTVAAVGSTVFCLVYAIWWLWVFWAPW